MANSKVSINMAFNLARSFGRLSATISKSEEGYQYRLNSKCDFCGTKCLRKLCPPCRDRVATKSLLGQDAVKGVTLHIINNDRNVVSTNIDNVELGMGYEWPDYSHLGFRVEAVRTMFGGRKVHASRSVQSPSITAEMMYALLMDLESNRITLDTKENDFDEYHNPPSPKAIRGRGR